MTNPHVVIIPAPLHGPRLQRYQLRPLNGHQPVKRAVELATGVAGDPSRVLVITDNDEVALFVERRGCSAVHDPALALRLSDSTPLAAADVALVLRHILVESETVVVINPDAPLLQLDDVLAAVERAERDRCHVSVYSGLTLDAELTSVWRRHALADGSLPVTHLVAPERSLKIRTQHDWWVADRLIRRRRIVFVVLGYPAVGLGHVYRATLLAHELLDHEVMFVCPSGSDLACERLLAEGFEVHRQSGDDLADCVLALKPNLVVNDVLHTATAYVRRLQSAGARVVNFEDLGTGALSADLVVNDIFMERGAAPNHLNGPEYFCIRDEFLDSDPSPFRLCPREILITFGGTDPANLTVRIGELVLRHAPDNVHVSFVAGPGYEHRDELRALLQRVDPARVESADSTRRMSEYMSRADLAFSSAGRTVFELAAMRVPSIIVAAHQREETHTFAAPENGFVYLGRANIVSNDDIVNALMRLLGSPELRRGMRERMSRWDFRHGRQRVVSAMTSLLMAPDRAGEAGRATR